MMKNLRFKIANIIAPERDLLLNSKMVLAQTKLRDIDETVNQRVAEALMKMDPFEPFFKKFHVVFSETYQQPEDKLSQPSKIQLYSWAYSNARDPSFKHLANWIQNVQGNNTLRKATNDYEWFFGRSAIITIELFIEQVSRLARLYEEVILRKDQGFDPNLTAE